MAITRIKTDQITDLAVTTPKIDNKAVTGGKLEDNLTYGSNFTVTGDLVVQGSTVTVDTSNMTVEDPLLVLSSGAATGAVDVGLLIERGADDSFAMIWDESADEFAFVNVGAEDGTTAGNLTFVTYANAHANNVTADGNASIAGDLSVTGTTSLAGPVTAGDLDVNSLDSATHVTVGTTLDVTGQSTLASVTATDIDASTLDTTGNVTVGGTLDVIGQSTLAGVTATDIDSDTLDTTGAVSVGTTLDVSGATTLTTVTATGQSTLAGVTATDIDSATLDTTGAVSVGTTLDVIGQSTLAGVTATDINSATLDTTGAVSVGTTLDVIGQSTLAGVTATDIDSATLDTTGDVTVGGTLDVTGATTLESSVTVNGGTGETFTITDGASVPVTTFSVDSATGNVSTTGTLTVDGQSTLAGVTATDIDASTLDTTGNVTVGGTLDVTSATTLTTVTVTGQSTLAGITATDIDASTLDTTGNVTVGGTLDVTGDTSLDGSVVVGNAATDIVTVNGTTTFLESVDFAGGLTVDPLQTVDMGGNVVNGVGTPVASSDAATKGYVDTQFSDVFTISDGVTDQSIAKGDTFVIAGTANEVDVAVSATDTLTIGLPNDVTIGNNLSVTNNLNVTGTGTFVGASSFNGAVTLGDAAVDAISVLGTMTVSTELAAKGGATFGDGVTPVTISASGNLIQNVQDPVSAQDAVTKSYLENQLSNDFKDMIIEGDSKVEVIDDGLATTEIVMDIDSQRVATVSSTGLTITDTLALKVGDIKVSGHTIESDADSNTIVIDPYPAGSGGKVIIEGDLTVTGTTTTIDSTVVTIADPVFQIGDDTVNDTLDRGIKALYNDGTTAKVAFFGIDDSDSEFVYIPDATDTSSVFSGTLGSAAFGSLRVEDLTDNRVLISGINGEIEDSANLTFDGSTLTVTGAANIANNATVGGTLGVTGNTTVGGTLGVTGAATLSSTLAVADDLSVATNKFTVDAVTGNTAVAGTLSVAGESTLSSATVSDLTDNRIVIAGLNGALEDSASLTFDGTTFEVGTAFDVVAATGNTAIGGTLSVTGSSTLTGSITAGSDLTVAGTTTLNGNVVVGDNALDTVTVTGTTTFVQSADFDGGLTVNTAQLVDMGANRVTNVANPTAAQDAATKSYVDQLVTDQDLDFAGDTGTGAVDLDSQTMTFAGTANEIVTVANGQTVTIGLPDDVTIGNNLVVTTNATVGGTLDVTGATTLESSVTVNGGVGETFTITDGAEVPVTTFSVNSETGATTTGDLVSNNTTVNGTLSTAGEATLASATVSDLTSGRVVLAGLDGSLEDSANLTFNGTTVSVTGGVSATGDVASATSTVSGNATVGGTLGVTGQSTLAGVTATDIDSATLDTTGNVTVGGTLAVTGASTMASVTATDVDVATLDASGNATVGGTLSVTGQSTLASAAISDLTDNQVVIAGVAGELEGDANFTFDGTSLNVGTGNFVVTAASGNTATLGTLDVAGLASLDGGINVNGVFTVTDVTGDVATSGTLDVSGEADLHTGVIVGSGGLVARHAEATLHVDGTDSMVLPAGTTAERPVTPVEGMFRYNTTTKTHEVYDGYEWSAGVDFTLIESETFTGDDVTTNFTLSNDQTTASCIVSINGVVQIPITAYGVSGTTLAFTEAPATGDIVEVRKLTTTTTPVGISDGIGEAKFDTNGDLAVTGNVVPSADVTYDLGSSTLKWRDLFLSGNTIHLGNIQLKDDNGSLKLLAADGITPAPIRAALDPDIAVDGGTY